MRGAAPSVFAVKLNYSLAHLLSQTITPEEDKAAGFCRSVLSDDFLECFGLGKFQRIVMNLPFANGGFITIPMRSSVSHRAAASSPFAPTDHAERPAPIHRGKARRHLGGAACRHFPRRRHQRSHRPSHGAELAPLCGAQGRCRFGLSPAPLFPLG